MGKVYEFVEEIDKSVSIIHGLLNGSNISVNEQKVQNGIKYICSNGAIFILYFSKGKTSKIYFEKENDELIHLMDKFFREKEETSGPKIPIYANYIWFSRKISKSLGELGQIDDAISKLEKLTIISDKWFLLYEIGKYYLQLNNLDEALTYMLRAVCTKDPERMKVALIESIGDLLTEIGDKSFAQDNYNYARQIRQNNDWSVANSLQRKITEEKEVVSKDIKKKWIQKLYQISPIV